ncbi:GGDEF domain-containing protein [Sporosarcina sp. FSL K6-1522]|uniref:GGDEF domain-containing protein n=1 Tax=Sporosarcina sp. FSL K6-1522 TaxID=2921554 RepID=UPI00315B106F
MLKHIETFDDLRWVIYLLLLPGIFLVTFVSFVLQIVNRNYTGEFYINSLFVIAFIVGWLSVYWKREQRIVEYYLLWLVIVYHVSRLVFTVWQHVQTAEMDTLRSFSMCTPLIILLIFFLLKKKQALRVSILLLTLSIVPGLLFYRQLDACFINLLIDFYISTAVYIIIIFFIHELFRMRGELKVIRRQLYVDALTQVGNRQQIDVWMKQYLDAAQGDGSFSLLFFDVDRFKQVNDCFGHKVGDDILQEIVRVVQVNMRKDAHLARWGGEEFIIILEVKECEALQIAERLRCKIEQHDFGAVGQITVSFGVTGYVQGDTAETIFVRADELLYASKASGRNCVTGKMMPKNDD